MYCTQFGLKLWVRTKEGEGNESEECSDVLVKVFYHFIQSLRVKKSKVPLYGLTFYKLKNKNFCVSRLDTCRRLQVLIQMYTVLSFRWHFHCVCPRFLPSPLRDESNLCVPGLSGLALLGGTVSHPGRSWDLRDVWGSNGSRGGGVTPVGVLWPVRPTERFLWSRGSVDVSDLGRCMKPY